MSKIHDAQNPKPKNIAELKPTQRAIADQSIRECLLAIIVAQGKPVRIPIPDLNAIAATHRLLIGVDHKAGVVILTTEAAQLIQDLKPAKIIGAEPEAFDGIVNPNAFRN